MRFVQTALSSGFPCSDIVLNPQNLKTELKFENSNKGLNSKQDPKEGIAKEHGVHPLDHDGSDRMSHQLKLSSSPN